MLRQQDWAIGHRLESRDACYDALKVQGHPEHEYDPTIALYDVLSDTMGRHPDRLTWVRESFNNGGAGRTAELPWLTWDIAEASGPDAVTLWHGCRADVALRKSREGYVIQPGPRRENSGNKEHNRDKAYAATNANTALAYTVPPMAPDVAVATPPGTVVG